MRGRPLNWFSIDRRWSKRSFLIVPATYSPTGVPSAGASQGGTLAFGLVSAVVNFGWWDAEKLARPIAFRRRRKVETAGNSFPPSSTVRVQADFTSIFFCCCCAAGVFGNVIVSKPFEKSAAILSRSMLAG